MFLKLCGSAMAVAFCLVVVSLGCSIENPDFDPPGGSGTTGSGTSGTGNGSGGTGDEGTGAGTGGTGTGGTGTGGTGTGGTGTGGDPEPCPCTLLDLSVDGLEVDTTNAVSGGEVLPDGTFELSWTVSYIADGCESPPPSIEFIEQARVTRGVPMPQLEVDENELTLAPGESMDRTALSTAFFAMLGASDYTAEVWLLDLDPVDGECPIDAGVIENNEGDDAPSIEFDLPPA